MGRILLRVAQIFHPDFSAKMRFSVRLGTYDTLETFFCHFVLVAH